MKKQSFDWYSWVVIGLGFPSSILFFYVLCYFSGCVSFSINSIRFFGGGLYFDCISFFLVLLNVFLCLSLWFFSGSMSALSKLLIAVSVFSSILSYCCSHALFFWVFYEMSIVPLLFLLVMESPYSERYIAGWYLLGYVVLTSLPMLLCLIYICLEFGSFCFLSWGPYTEVSKLVFILLGVMFITKIPLPPFHVWLPIVHAEASSSVSVCLSGYIMKLGVLGLCRFCYWVLPSEVFGMSYMVCVLCLGVSFFLMACRELDGKRWLALLSLSHILIASVCLSVSSWDTFSISLLFCLGHGLSAGVIFISLWVVYKMCGSRNWVILKSCLPGSFFLRFLFVACLCTAGSLPPTLQFFSEVFVVSLSSGFSGVYIPVFFLYIFASGLVPLFLLGTLLSRHYVIGFADSYVFGLCGSMVFLCGWGYLLFLVC